MMKKRTQALVLLVCAISVAIPVLYSAWSKQQAVNHSKAARQLFIELRSRQRDRLEEMLTDGTPQNPAYVLRLADLDFEDRRYGRSWELYNLAKHLGGKLSAIQAVRRPRIEKEFFKYTAKECEPLRPPFFLPTSDPSTGLSYDPAPLNPPPTLSPEVAIHFAAAQIDWLRRWHLFDAAKRDLDLALRFDPDAEKLLYQATLFHLDRGDRNGAEAFFERLKKNHPSSYTTKVMVPLWNPNTKPQTLGATIEETILKEREASRLEFLKIGRKMAETADSADSIPELLKIGFRALSMGQLIEATRAFHRVKLKSPDNADAARGLRLVHHAQRAHD